MARERTTTKPAPAKHPGDDQRRRDEHGRFAKGHADRAGARQPEPGRLILGTDDLGCGMPDTAER